MKIGIVCAGDEELEPFLPIIENCKIYAYINEK